MIHEFGTLVKNHGNAHIGSNGWSSHHVLFTSYYVFTQIVEGEFPER